MKRKAAKKNFARLNSPSPKRIVNIRQLGDVVNLKERRLYMLRHEGLPQIAPGQYDLRACLRWYVRYLQRKDQENVGDLFGGERRWSRSPFPPYRTPDPSRVARNGRRFPRGMESVDRSPTRQERVARVTRAGKLVLTLASAFQRSRSPP
jgi:hypothetical protein